MFSAGLIVSSRVSSEIKYGYIGPRGVIGQCSKKRKGWMLLFSLWSVGILLKLRLSWNKSRLLNFYCSF